MDVETFYGLGIALVFVGVFVVLTGILLLVFSNKEKKKIRGGGVILIGPFPIIFGTDRESVKILLLLSILLIILAVIAIVILHFVSIGS